MTVRKPKAKAKAKPKITVKVAPPVPQMVKVPIRCVWDSRLIIGGDKTPSGTRYEFNIGETKPVLEQDYQFLLDMRSRAPGCCGGAGGSSTHSIQKYFEEV